MTEQTKHTTTPWAVNSDKLTITAGDNGGVVAKTSAWWFPTEQAEANSKFIVKACNEYDKLEQLLDVMQVAISRGDPVSVAWLVRRVKRFRPETN